MTGAVVVVDVLRGFTTAAYAFARRRPTDLAGQLGRGSADAEVDAAADAGDGGKSRAAGCPDSTSPTPRRSSLKRTSPGTTSSSAPQLARAVSSRPARTTRRWCASLVCATATATAAAVTESGLGKPSYVITGWFDPQHPGEDDVQTARLIERIRRGKPTRVEPTAAAIAGSREAVVTLAPWTGARRPTRP